MKVQRGEEKLPPPQMAGAAKQRKGMLGTASGDHECPTWLKHTEPVTEVLNAKPWGLKFRMHSKIQLRSRTKIHWRTTSGFCSTMVATNHPAKSGPHNESSPDKLQGAATFSFLHMES